MAVLRPARTNEGVYITNVEANRAQCEWKAAAYATHIAENRNDARLIEKHAYWTAERDRLRLHDTTRTAR